MVKVIAGILRRSGRTVRVDALSSQDRERLLAAAERARTRLQEAGMLDIERDAQREIRARIDAA